MDIPPLCLHKVVSYILDACPHEFYYKQTYFTSPAPLKIVYRVRSHANAAEMNMAESFPDCFTSQL